MTTAFQFNPFTGNFDLVTTGLTPGDITGGSPNSFGGFDSTGTLFSIPNWSIDTTFTPSRFGLNATFQIDPAASPGYNETNRISSQLIPTANAPTDSEVLLQMSTDLDPTNTGFGVGAPNGLAMRILDLNTTAHTSSVNGQVQVLNIDADLGDGVITGGIIDQYIPINSFARIQNGFTVNTARIISSNLQSDIGSSIINGAEGYNFNAQINGSFTNNFNGFIVEGNFTPTNAFSGGLDNFHAGLNIAGNVGNGRAFSDGTQFQTGSNVTGDWNSASLGPNFQAGSIVRSYTGLTVNPQFTASITDDIRGLGVFFNAPTAGTNISGMDININNATASGGNINGLNIQINNSTDSNPQGVTGLQSNSRLSINATTQLQSAQTFQIGSRIEHAFSVPPGSPVTGTDELAINIAGDFLIQDNVANGPLGIGLNSVGFISSMGVAATKTVDAITVFLPAAALPDPGYTTGGTADQFHHIRIFPPLPQGGTLTINNLYALKLDSMFGDYAASATNAWGLYLDSSADNFMGRGELQLGGATSGLLSIQAAATTASHTLTMPSAQGAAATVLTNDGAGNLSWALAGSGGGPTTFTLANNETTLTDITGFLVDPTLHSAFTSDISIVRSNTAGTPVLLQQEDTAFYASLGSAFVGRINNITQQADTAILIAGQFTSFNGSTRNRLLRLNANGTEDTAFYGNFTSAFNNDVNSIYEQADTKILVGGVFTDFDGLTRNRLVRLNSDGTEDTAFYTNLGAGFNSAVNFVYEQADTKILVGGQFTSFNGNTRNRLVRLNSDGTEDTAFYSNMGTAFNSAVKSVIEQTDTAIIVGGTFTSHNGNTRNRLLRLNSDGSEDTAFYTNLGTAFDDVVNTAIEQADTKILVGGVFQDFNGNVRNRLVRLNSDGTEDTAFYTNLGTGFGLDVVTVFEQTDTKILVGGTFTSLNGNTRNNLVRLNSDGTEDTAFYTLLGSAFNNEVNTVTVQANDEILIGGNFTSFNGNTRNSIIRFNVLFTPPAIELVYVGEIKGIYRSLTTSWSIDQFSSVGDNTGVTFNMTNLGQMQYRSSNLSTGTVVVSQLKFEILEL